MQRLYLILIAATVVASGCTGTTAEEDKPSPSCSSITLKVEYANGEMARIVNLGSTSFGNATITWNYVDETSVTKTVELPPPGEKAVVESGENRGITQVDVTHTECPSENDSF